MPTRYFLVFLLLVLPAFCQAQQETPDTVSAVNKRANRAALMSAILPGSGQFYNKSYWKIPLLYAGAGTLIYFIGENNSEYETYKQAYSFRLDNDSTTNDTEFGNLNDEDIKVRMDFYRRNRDFCYVMLGVLYVLNVVDAYVDAHLKDFDIIDNLSLETRPALFLPRPGQAAAGITLCLKLKR